MTQGEGGGETGGARPNDDGIFVSPFLFNQRCCSWSSPYIYAGCC